MRFTYRTGERPLPGYTIKRGVGQGGFGEVYFAVSDSGKEVALKLLRNASDVELRGIANCLNLKHPGLVHIYDLRTDERGDQWLVMEYVLGETMGNVIDRHPNGLPIPLTVEWFGSLARAVGYLHDHGVVHRDLKPGNVFVEHGNLKVGDYGLCKAMSATGRQQTRAVGTVLYMAPEIGSGNYTKAIDIYACGILLHEMLTGKPPFEGEIDAEILMKHLTAVPDVEKLPEAFRPIVLKALAKDPEKRYGTMAEFARAVEEAAGVATPAVPQAERPLPIAKPVVKSAEARPLPITKVPTVAFRDRMTDLSGAMVRAPIVSIIATVPWAVISQTTEWTVLGKMFLLTLAISWSVILAAGGAARNVSEAWGCRLRQALFGVAIGVLAFWLDGWPVPDVVTGEEVSSAESYLFGTIQMSPKAVPVLTHYAMFFAATLGVMRWWRITARNREQRIGLFPLFAAGMWGLVLSFLWPHRVGPSEYGVLPLVVAAAVVQWVSPWTPPPPPLPKKRRYQG